jgi:hypothetical protein
MQTWVETNTNVEYCVQMSVVAEPEGLIRKHLRIQRSEMADRLQTPQCASYI